MDNGELIVTALLSAWIWAIIHSIVNDRLILRCLPASVRSYTEARKLTDPDFKTACEINGTAFSHACIVAPLSTYVGFRLIAEDPWKGESALFEMVAIIMLGYFLWDIYVTVMNFRVYGLTFIFHALMTFVGLWVQMGTGKFRMVGLAANFAATELSTPFLHCRWFCLKAKHTENMYFWITNYSFLLTFVCMRTIYVPLYIFPQYWYHLYSGAKEGYLSAPLQVVQLFITLSWTVLNYYWGVMLLVGQYKRQRSATARKEASKTR